MARLWTEKSKNGSMPSFQMANILPQIRKNLELDEEALDEMVTELDKGKGILFCFIARLTFRNQIK